MQAEADQLEFTWMREYDAPRALVWAAWTDPKEAAQWWGPRGFTTPVFEADVRAGGRYRIDMVDPDGDVYCDSGTYEEIDAPHRLVQFGEVARGTTKMFSARTVVTFEEAGSKTRVIVRQTLSDIAPETADAIGGANEGWEQHFDCLGEYLAERSA